jgi:hypothetical protein
MRIFVTSLDRPGNVAPMMELAGEAELVWCVPEEQADAYRAHGAEHIEVGPPGKCEKINAILDSHAEEWCVFTDDDCRRLTRLNADGSYERITLDEAAREYVRVGIERRDHFVTIPNMQNVRFASRKVSNWGSTVGWFGAIAPHTECRYDPSLVIAHDVDFAAQVFDRYGRISRVGWIIGEYRYADKASHFRDEHANRQRGNGEVILRYPHLLYWKSDQDFGFRRVP